MSAQVSSYIFALIEAQKPGPGDEVPSEIQLIKELGVSRGVIREAFRSLGTLGVLEIESDKRPRVQSFNPQALAMIFRYALATQQISAKQVLEIRRALEIGSVGLAAKHASEAQLSNTAGEMDHICRTYGRPAEFVVHDAQFHVAIAEASLTPLYSLMLRALRGALEHSMWPGSRHKVTKSQSHNERTETIVELHQDIINRRLDCDAQGAIGGHGRAFRFRSPGFDRSRNR